MKNINLKARFLQVFQNPSTNSFFLIWTFSLLMIVGSYLLRAFQLIDKSTLGVLYFIALIIGLYSFLRWARHLRKLSTAKERRLGITSTLVIFGLFILIMNRAESAMPLSSDSDLILAKSDHIKGDYLNNDNQSSLSSSVYEYEGYEPKKTLQNERTDWIYNQDLTIQNDPRRFYIHKFDDSLKPISAGISNGAEIVKNGVTAFKIYGNNQFSNQLLSEAESDNVYALENVFYSKTSFEKNVKIFSQNNQGNLTTHFLFEYGELDYLISAEWNVEEVYYRELADKIIATLIPTTISKKVGEEFTSETSISKQMSTPSPLPAVDPNLKSTCYVDKDGSFEMTAEECLALNKSNPDEFRWKAFKYCLDGKNPEIGDDGTKESREEPCMKMFGYERRN